MPPQCTFIPDIGVCAELTDRTLKQGESFPAGARLIDGSGFEDYGTSEVLKDRLRMSGEGLFIVSVAVSRGSVVGGPVIESRGFVCPDEQDCLRELKDVAEKAVTGAGKGADREELEGAIRRAVKNWIFKRTKQSPLIVPVITEL